MNYNLLTQEVENRLAKPLFPLRSIGSIEAVLQYGCSTRAVEEHVGFPILRMNNLQANGWDLADLKYVDVSETEFLRWRLEPDDIIINRTNSKELVGKSEVFEEKGDWLFASYLMRLRVKADEAVPAFISAFLSTRAGRAQIDRQSRQIIGMSNINAEEIRSIRIPLPPKHTQIALVRSLAAARNSLRDGLADATRQLSTIDDYVLEALGLRLAPGAAHRSTYAVRPGDIQAAKKLHPDFFHPERIDAIRVVEEHYGRDQTKTLSAIADFVRQQKEVCPGDDYLGLANVQPNTGERLASDGEELRGTAYQYQTDDVLFARLRPYLNKVYRAEFEGVCSTEFHVIRLRKRMTGEEVVLPEYLACVLRSSVVLGQTRHMMTGNTHPRLANEDVTRLVIPIPSASVQQRIADEMANRRSASRRLRSDAVNLWQQALRGFEEQLLGPEPNHMPTLSSAASKEVVL